MRTKFRLNFQNNLQNNFSVTLRERKRKRETETQTDKEIPVFRRLAFDNKFFTAGDKLNSPFVFIQGSSILKEAESNAFLC